MGEKWKLNIKKLDIGYFRFKSIIMCHYKIVNFCFLEKPGHHYKACFRFKEDCASGELKYDPVERRFYRVKADEEKKDRREATEPPRKRKAADTPPRREKSKRRDRR